MYCFLLQNGFDGYLWKETKRRESVYGQRWGVMGGGEDITLSKFSLSLRLRFLRSFQVIISV